jgi:hypothetical protein
MPTCMPVLMQRCRFYKVHTFTIKFMHVFFLKRYFVSGYEIFLTAIPVSLFKQKTQRDKEYDECRTLVFKLNGLFFTSFELKF